MASSSSDPGLKAEGGGGGGGGEASEAVMANDQLLLYRGLKKAKKERGCTAKERISKMPPCAAGKRSSIYRGVTRHRWTGRYEAHLWDKSTWNQNQNKKGKQGAYDDEEAAARAYDLAALKYWGPGTLINFPVSDYSRDLKEMQNVSREDYLASLRRCLFILPSMYIELNGTIAYSRWLLVAGKVVVSQEGSLNIVDSPGTSEDAARESEYVGRCIERKIDLTGYIKWWGPNKMRQADSLTKSLEVTKHGDIGDVGSELKALEWAVHPTEPYQMPHLGLSHEGKKHKGSAVSALSILSRSAAYKSLQEKALKKQDNNTENNENENINDNNKKLDYGKAIQKSSSGDGGSKRLGVTLGMSGMSLQRSVYPLTPFLSAPLLTSYNSIDPLADPILWTSLVPVLPTGLSHTTEVSISAIECCFV
ncbi:hypothetical protein HHK36_011879 [Tetracentron sinense]|uniref:AP2/ERF domain-containing protein n=1 Tax=Tetracentron sinense TaxID=13715 RepID=A0A835DKV5_TETSI|nr:hypothetical protein HHK36_011879 [Tetracentron sinense]